MGEVFLSDGDMWALCRQLMAERGLTLVHPFDDEAVMAGQGTVGLEIVEDCLWSKSSSCRWGAAG
jgi:threonine dehydratase